VSEAANRIAAALERIATALERAGASSPAPGAAKRRKRAAITTAPRLAEPTELDRKRAELALRRAGLV
jgi:hypothetical protein